ncbi:MAG: hypothetical protein JRD04_13180, partial [Deltaproteobacteria bacterium]|nr:hypothetical protein [Deltaproteobacteria bacterium]
MAKKKKYKPSKKVIGMSVLAVLVILFAVFWLVPHISTKMFNSEDYNYTSNGSIDMSSNGGGSGGGGGGTPATTGDGEDGCVGECPAVWVEDEPMKSTRDGGLLDFFGIDRFLVPAPTGEWECEGLCKNEAELCIFDPTDVVPAEGYVDPNIPPNCVCLKPQAGGCNFYDANYGVGDENIICGGSCPYNSQCMIFPSGEVDVCRCLVSPYGDECGMHYPEQYLKSPSGELVVPNTLTEDDCYGFCTIANTCTFDYDFDFDIKAKIPVCYCPESPAQDPDPTDQDESYPA